MPRQIEIPPDIEAAIVTPHLHEGPNNRPLWIIWWYESGRDGLADPPTIDSISDTEHSARYHVTAMLERQTGVRAAPAWARGKHELLFFVERVPANHSFASSVARVLPEGTPLADRPKRQEPFEGSTYRYRRSGD